MSEDKDPYITEEDPEWEDVEQSNKIDEEQQDEPLSFGTTPIQETQQQYAEDGTPIDPAVLEAEELKKKRIRKILIIIFAITLPIIIAGAALGFFIWGLVVGFTNCCNQCEAACDNCCGCFDSCVSCTNCCNDCSSSCDNCCSNSIQGNISGSKQTIKEVFHASIAMIKWYYYYIEEYIRNFFFK